MPCELPWIDEVPISLRQHGAADPDLHVLLDAGDVRTVGAAVEICVQGVAPLVDVDVLQVEEQRIGEDRVLIDRQHREHHRKGHEELPEALPVHAADDGGNHIREGPDVAELC